MDPILHVDIRVNSQKVERVTLRLSDDPAKAAAAFIRKYRLDPNINGKLTQVLKINIEKVRKDASR
jgi:hypothetical protein